MRAEKMGGRQDTSRSRRRKGRSTLQKGVSAFTHLLRTLEDWYSISLTIRGMWSLACLDLLLWRRMPLALVSALIPPLSMALMLVVLSYTVLQQPVALVKLSHGP